MRALQGVACGSSMPRVHEELRLAARLAASLAAWLCNCTSVLRKLYTGGWRLRGRRCWQASWVLCGIRPLNVLCGRARAGHSSSSVAGCDYVPCICESSSSRATSLWEVRRRHAA